MQWLISGLGMLVGLVAIVLLWGAFLPKEHSYTVARTYAASAEHVWKLITEVENFPLWRKDVKSVEITERDAAGAPLAWIEETKHGPIPLRTVEAVAPSRLVGRIDSEKLPWGGAWTYGIEDLGGETVRLSITEDGEVSNVLFRFLSRYVFGHDKTMLQYHEHLGAELDG